MKTFLKGLALTSLGIVLTVGFFAYSSPSLPEVLAQSGGGGSITPFLDTINYLKSLPSSTIINTAQHPYALPAVNIYAQQYSGVGPVQMDVNGDGMLDLVISYIYSGNNFQYVMLNTGQGFEFAYSCFHDSSLYYGDCAG